MGALFIAWISRWKAEKGASAHAAAAPLLSRRSATSVKADGGHRPCGLANCTDHHLPHSGISSDHARSVRCVYGSRSRARCLRQAVSFLEIRVPQHSHVGFLIGLVLCVERGRRGCSCTRTGAHDILLRFLFLGYPALATPVG